MAEFVPVVIQKSGSHYVLAQGNELLLRFPAAVFDRFDAGSVFPPSWEAPGGVHPVRRLYWNPQTREMLIFGLDEQPVRFGETFGPSGYRSFVQGFWVPTPPLVLLRPYWSPPDPQQPFDAAARRKSYGAQRAFLEILERLRPPEGWSVVLNAVDAYLDALGVNPEGQAGDPGDILELSLTPPAPLDDPAAAAALETLAVEQVGDCFPVLRRKALAGVHTLGLRELLEAEAALGRAGLECRQGQAFPH